MTVEICVEGPDGAAAAAAAGADRVELCAALEVGGVTPSRGALLATRRLFPRELTVLIRPRPGDFVPTRAERDAIRRDVDDARELGADGVTLGCLRADGTIDVPEMARLVERAGAMAVTFHRAIDVCVDPVLAVAELAEIGVTRILSSGGAARAPDGVAVLRRMVLRAGDRLLVMAGAGVRSTNVRALVAATGVRAVHASASVPGEVSPRGFGRGSIADPDEMRALVAAVRGGG